MHRCLCSCFLSLSVLSYCDIYTYRVIFSQQQPNHRRSAWACRVLQTPSWLTPGRRARARGAEVSVFHSRANGSAFDPRCPQPLSSSWMSLRGSGRVCRQHDSNGAKLQVCLYILSLQDVFFMLHLIPSTTQRGSGLFRLETLEVCSSLSRYFLVVCSVHVGQHIRWCRT